MFIQFFKNLISICRRLTLKTVQILLNNSQLTYEDLCADPHSLLRFSLEFYK